MEQYLGIPYAEPPIGDLRFKSPEPAKPWIGILDATSSKASCPQPKVKGENATSTSEDCLYMNIWTPKRGQKSREEFLPVLFWVNPGAFYFLTSNLPDFYGTALAAFENVFVVIFDFRIGMFGLLYTGTDDAPGNMAVRDQILALKWVHRHISKFGGDPNKIVFGASTGGIS